MFESVAGLFGDKYKDKTLVVTANEARMWVERWLRDKCGSEAVYCERCEGGVVCVRVGLGWLRQEVVLWQEDLLAALREDLQLECSRVQFVF